MSIGPKTITVFLDASSSGQKRAAYAAALAQRWEAHLVGMYVVYAGVMSHPSMSYARGHEAAKHVIDHEQRLDASAEARAAIVAAQFRALCTRLNVPGEFRPIKRGKTAEEAIASSLHSDSVVVGHPEPSGLPDDMSSERLLLASGGPLLVVPNAWEGETIGDRILVGWNATRQSKRAIFDGMGFLEKAATVTVLTIDAAERRWHGAEPGADIAMHLARHGARVNVEQMESNGSPISRIILRRAQETASDLLIVGAYSHARLKELLLGGVTRTLLAQMPVPVLISK